MKELIVSLISIIEIFILGVFALIVIVYFIITFHPLKKYLTNYYEVVTEFIRNDNIPSKYKNYIQISAVVGIIYYGGMLVNVVDYWFLEPLHFRIICEVEDCSSCDTTNTFMYNTSLTDYLNDPFTENIDSSMFDNYKCYIKHSVNSKDNTDLQKFIRLIRGTAFISILIFGIAFLKSIISMIVLLFHIRKNRFGNWLYKNFISEQSNDNNWWKSLKTILFTNLFISLFALFIYSISIKSFVVLEREFHMKVSAEAKINEEAKDNATANKTKTINEETKDTILQNKQ